MIFKNFISKVVAFTWFLLLIITFLSCKKAPTDVPEIITKITGKVTDGQTNLSLAGVQIITNPSTSSVITGSDGNYTISNVSPGQYTMTAKKDGYNDNTVTVSVAEGKTVNADIQLMPLGPELAVSVSILDFDVSLTNLSFTITNKSKVGIVTWQISVDQAWLTVTPISGTTTTESDVISVSASRTGLSPGNYAATITINSDYGSKQISVLAVIPNPAAPQLTVIPTTLDFGTSSGGQVLTIKNTGTGNLNWNANPGSTWILLSNNSGSIAPGNSSSVNVSINKSGLVPNNYEGIISITSNGGNQNINVKMIVEAGTLSPPTLQIIGATTQSSITFGWTKVSDPNFASYKIYRSIAPSVNESSTLVTTITDYNQNTYTDNGLSSGTTYYYRVFVYSKSGVGSGSNEVSATTKKVLGTWASNATIPDVSSAYLANSLYPLSENDVWFVYGTKIWHYNGLSWANTFTLSTGSLKAVYFLNENLGWVVGSSGLIYVYNGVTWTKITSSVIGTNFLNDIVAFSENDIWISGQGALFHFDGSNWNKISVAAYSYGRS